MLSGSEAGEKGKQQGPVWLPQVDWQVCVEPEGRQSLAGCVSSLGLQGGVKLGMPGLISLALQRWELMQAMGEFGDRGWGLDFSTDLKVCQPLLGQLVARQNVLRK